ncbi:hypothetical protein [Thermodesulfovibrio yellowstonii]|uniref:Uncharacterized protein n=2 Tax=Thermodesulfovibrio yellowstonii TaxID=28262 RepID=B5YHZ4_THEYD|nr:MULTISPECIES: hypothetical protein [Thermodesulfovibrio]ACI21465.1 hypothetical protein THEYE_A0211 [Thermodesulfovibrio yellowstonii DSM 11347]MBC7189862.1 hypothetical protein [Candidatus Aerophobetes bacterium]MDI6864717.1 hypothetical protein [Thermodesulfovibrio yellowstonii]GLI54397.1 hypothetical protein TISLANDTSLP1_20900 [Thermodesulfovibrio islandicus]
MTREFKISLIIFLLSTLIFIVSLKLKPPSFITQTEKTIAEYPLPEITIREKSLFAHNSLNNPFGILKTVKIEEGLKEPLKLKESPLPILSFIYEGRYKYAVIGNSIVREGDSINGYQIKGIFKDKVLIQDKKGETKWLKLENY